MLKRILFSILALLIPFLPIVGAGHRFTLVVDAGHGGHDSGARGAFSAEKNLTLKFALAFGRLVEQRCPDVKVIYTRKTDVFVPLHERADIANRHKADLFISIHINALTPGHLAHGFQSYTLGSGAHSGDRGIKENLEVAKRENSVIFLEKDYKTQYKGYDNSAEGDIMFEFIADKNRERSVELSRLMQQEVCKATGRVDGGSHQNNLAVLRLTSMPAALLELGFISTPDEEQFLNSDSATDLYARGIYNAFVIYKNKYNDNINVPYRDQSEPLGSAMVGDGATKARSNRSRRSTTIDEPSLQRPVNTASAGMSSSSENAGGKGISRQPDMPAENEILPLTGKIDDSKPVFKIQLLASTRRFKADDAFFQGLTGCECYEEGGFHKYTYGASNNYDAIYRLRRQLLDKFPQCFIIAFKNGKRMDINEGISEFRANR